jgi:hypothetical protein
MKRLLHACALLLATALPVSAQQGPVVVELFTSQGCSSCPPADAILHELANRAEVIALALHVDYWDYIGWKDEFADPRYADRQRAYAQRGGRKSIYTPQMVVMGQTDIIGAKPMKLSEVIMDHMAQPQPVRVALERSGDQVRITARTVGQVTGPMVVHLVRYQPLRETRITRGENKGHTFQYANVTEGWTVLGDWDGSAPLDMTAAASGAHPVVVIVQDPRGGPIYGAARLK